MKSCKANVSSILHEMRAETTSRHAARSERGATARWWQATIIIGAVAIAPGVAGRAFGRPPAKTKLRLWRGSGGQGGAFGALLWLIQLIGKPPRLESNIGCEPDFLLAERQEADPNWADFRIAVFRMRAQTHI